MKIYSIQEGTIQAGSMVTPYTLKTGAIMPVLAVGEEGRGRKYSIVPVQLSQYNQKQFEKGDQAILLNAVVGTTKAGGVKLIEIFPDDEEQQKEEAFLGVFKTPIGFRGGNNHTGDRKEIDNIEAGFLEWPGRNIVEGTIAQGKAGAMGLGSQFITIMPYNVVFRTAYTGRFYGTLSAHYYKASKEKGILVATWEERVKFILF